MVPLTEVRKANAAFKSRENFGLTCVFAGATSGTGAATLERIVTMVKSSTFYIIARSTSDFSTQQTKLGNLGPSCQFIFVEGEVSLISGVDAMCKRIMAAEKKIDILFMSCGMLPFNGPEYTNEGLDLTFAISHYCRMRPASNLLPLLRQSPHPRVISVLNAGKEKLMSNEDLGLAQRWSIFSVMKHTITMTSVSFEHLAQNDTRILFLHVAPGLVMTDNFSRLEAPDSSGIVWTIVLELIKGLICVIRMFLGVTLEEAGERNAFHLTSDIYRPGAWRINKKSDLVLEDSVLEQYREHRWRERVWEHNMRVFDEALTTRGVL